MDISVVGWRAVVQNEFLGARARLANLIVQIQVGPLLQTCRLALWQIRLLREFGFRQIDCLLEFKCRYFSGHKHYASKKRNSNRLNARSSKSPSPKGSGNTPNQNPNHLLFETMVRAFKPLDVLRCQPINISSSP